MRFILFYVMLGLCVATPMAFADNDGPSMVGTWTNADPTTKGTVQISITEDHGKIIIEAWGSCHPKPCDWGKTPLDLLGDTAGAKEMPYGFATWDQKFKEVHMAVQLDHDELIVETYNIFKDKSGRSNYRSVEHFKAAKH